MRNKFFSFILLIAVLILGATACASPIVQAAPVAQGTEETETTGSEFPRTLNVNGHGEVSLAPDIAYLYVGVHTENEDAAAAVAENNVNAQTVIDALKDAGVQAEDISTTNFSLWTSQNYDFEGRPSESKFVVDNTVFIIVRDLEQLGDILGTAIDAGANNVNGVSFDVSDKETALAEARELAVAEARAQAEELAGLAEVELGNIQTITLNRGYPTPYFDGYGRGGAVEEAALTVPISPGQYVVSVDVNIVFEIK